MNKETRMTAQKKTKPAGTSREAQWIGLLVLGFGAICVLAVGFFIFANMRSSGQDTAESAGQQSAQVQQTQKEQNKNAGDADDVRAELSRSLSAIRDSGSADTKNSSKDAEVSEAQIRGGWETILTKNMTGIMDLSKGRYRIILANDSPSAYRFFSNGTYEVIGKNILILTPNTQAQAPKDGFRYRPVYGQPFSVQMERKGDYMIWSRPPASAPGRNPSSHPLLRLADDNTMIWKAF